MYSAVLVHHLHEINKYSFLVCVLLWLCRRTVGSSLVGPAWNGKPAPGWTAWPQPGGPPASSKPLSAKTETRKDWGFKRKNTEDGLESSLEHTPSRCSLMHHKIKKLAVSSEMSWGMSARNRWLSSHLRNIPVKEHAVLSICMLIKFLNSNILWFTHQSASALSHDFEENSCACSNQRLLADSERWWCSRQK